jgi:hypothetical protein
LLSTWRIDAGREPGSWRDPDDLLSQLRPAEMEQNVKKILEEYCAFEQTEIDAPGIRALSDYIIKKQN